RYRLVEHAHAFRDTARIRSKMELGVCSKRPLPYGRGSMGVSPSIAAPWRQHGTATVRKRPLATATTFPRREMRGVGKVYLIGAGPGDPELITWKGRRLLARADSILFDHLANEALLDLAPAGAERLYVGKKKSTHSFSQEEICEML